MRFGTIGFRFMALNVSNVVIFSEPPRPRFVQTVGINRVTWSRVLYKNRR